MLMEKKRGFFSFLFAITKEKLGLWLVAAILNSLQTFLVTVFYGFALKYTLDGISSGNETEFKIGVIIMLIGSCYFIFGLPFFSYLLYKSMSMVKSKIRQNIFKRIVAFKYSDIEYTHSGKYLSIMHNDIDRIMNLFDWSFIGMLQAIISGIFSIFIIFYYSKIIVFVSLISGIIILYLSFINLKINKSLNEQLYEHFSERMKLAADFVDNFILIKIYDIVSVITSSIYDLCQSIYHCQVSINKFGVVLNSLKSVITELILFGVVIFIGSYQIAQGDLTFGELMLILQLGVGIVFFFNSIGNYFISTQYSFLCLERVYNECMRVVVEEKHAILTKKTQASLEFEQVTFGYDSRGQKVLDNISFCLEGPAIVNLTGKNGTGKSTIFKLIMKLYSPQSGTIKINGVDIQNVSQENISKIVACVPQKIIFFEDTIYNNLTYGLSISELELESIAESVGILELIDSFPNRFEEILFEGGYELSGGEKQRLALVRALAQHPDILLLDEFDSNMDPLSAQKIYNYLNSNNILAVIVTHNMENILKSSIVSGKKYTEISL